MMTMMMHNNNNMLSTEKMFLLISSRVTPSDVNQQRHDRDFFESLSSWCRFLIYFYTTTVVVISFTAVSCAGRDLDDVCSRFLSRTVLVNGIMICAGPALNKILPWALMAVYFALFACSSIASVLAFSSSECVSKMQESCHGLLGIAGVLLSIADIGALGIVVFTLYGHEVNFRDIGPALLSWVRCCRC